MAEKEGAVEGTRSGCVSGLLISQGSMCFQNTSLSMGLPRGAGPTSLSLSDPQLPSRPPDLGSLHGPWGGQRCEMSCIVPFAGKSFYSFPWVPEKIQDLRLSYFFDCDL